MGFKLYESLTFTDDFMFCKVMQSEPELCEALTSLVLGRQVHIASNVEKQKAIEIIADGRGIRMDVYFEDDEKTHYNLEMQNSSDRSLPQRSRYYQSMIDLSMLERGMHFDELEDSFVIFLCKFDPFERGMYRYSFQNACEEKPELKLSDGTFKVFINARSAAEDASDEMRALLAYLMDGHVGSDLTRRIEACVEAGRQRETWKMIYFEQNSREATIRREAKAEGERIGFENGEKVGFENGEKAGAKQNSVDTARKMKTRGFDTETISDLTGLSEEEIEALK